MFVQTLFRASPGELRILLETRAERALGRGLAQLLCHAAIEAATACPTLRQTAGPASFRAGTQSPLREL